MVEATCMFHLRRVQFQAFVKDKGRPSDLQINDGLEPAKEVVVLARSTMILLDRQTKIGRNPELVDVVLHSVVHSNMISRDHSEIVGEQDAEGRFTRYFISDRSLNGTYVNDTRVKDLQQLKEGDLIKFGHVNGAAIKAGEFAPQQAAEFIFRFERALPNYTYFGYSQKGQRVQHEHRRAYMQINSDRILPTEVYSTAALAAPKPLPASTGTSSTTAPAPVTVINSSTVPIPTLSSAPTTAPAPSVTSSAVPVSQQVPPTAQAAAAAANQLAHLASVAAAAAQHQQQQVKKFFYNFFTFQAPTTTASAQLMASTQQAQQQQTLNNALNQLGLTTNNNSTTTDDQVAAMNAQLRSLMASHDAMSAMERLAAQQQWQKSLLNLNQLQQQNPLIYGHAFPAAAAAAAALFTGMGGIDLNSAAAAANPTAAQYAATLWPNIRATLQPAGVAPQQDWTQQQKAAMLAQQLQLRLPGNLYQPQAQQMQQQQQARAASVAAGVTVASSLFGAPSAFSLPGQQQQGNGNPSTSIAATAAGLLIAAHAGQAHPSTSSSSSAAYSSCTSSNSQPPGIRPGAVPLSRGTSSSTLTANVPTSSDLSAAAVRLAAAQQLAKEALEADQAKAATNWSNIGISCSSAPAPGVVNNGTTGSTKVSPILAAATAARIPQASGAFQTATPVNNAAQLQRIPGIASALAAAAAAAVQAQQQQHVNGGTGVVWQPGNTPPVVPTPTASSTPATNPANLPHQMASATPLGTPPIQQPLAQRLLATGNNCSALSLSGGSKSSSSSSGISSASGASTMGLLQSPTVAGQQQQSSTFRDSLSSACTSSLNSSGTNSAFSTPAQNTSLSSLTAAMFASAEEATKRQQSAALQHRRSSTSGVGANANVGGNAVAGEVNNSRRSSLLKREKTVPNLSIPNTSASTSTPSSTTQQQNGSNGTNDESKSNAGGKQLMECDSSVPSPPSKQHDEEMPSRPNSVKEEDDMDGNKEKTETTRKRHSDTTKSGDSNTNKDNKPKPVKQARKSNEVARLLNDLTAGNCSWQYMAERQQKIATKSTKSSSNNKETTSTKDTKEAAKAARDRKKPLRLDERKQLEMEKKRAHNMMRQISDESSGDEHQLRDKEDNVVADSEDERCNGLNGNMEKVTIRNQSESSDSVSFGKHIRKGCDIDGFKCNTTVEQDKEDNSDGSTQEEDNSNSDSEFEGAAKGKAKPSAKPSASASNTNLVNGGGKRKLPTSSTTTNKKTTAAKEEKPEKKEKSLVANGQPDGEKASKKRGPKSAEEKKAASSSAAVANVGRTRKNTAGSISSNATAGTNGTTAKRGRKAGTSASGRGRKPAASADSDNDSSENTDGEEETDNGKTSAAVVEKAPPAKSKRGRKAGTTKADKDTNNGKKAAAATAENTVMEDWTGGTGDPDKCAHDECQRPKDMEVNWVGCDGCEAWYHTTCVFGDNRAYDDAEWFCAECR